MFQLLNEAATPATVADRLETSIQNVHYHLGNLEDAGLIEVVDTCYSEKGREMEVFVVAEDPTVVFLGTSDDRTSIKRAFSAFSSFVGPTAVFLSIAELFSRFTNDD